MTIIFISMTWNINNYTIDDLNTHSRKGLIERLGITFSKIVPFEIHATMPVEPNIQPLGLLHGGAHCVLAESLGSVGSFISINQNDFFVAGQNLNANHLKATKSGIVTGICKIVHLGNRNHLWETKIFNQNQELLSIVQLSVAIVKKKT